MLEEVVNWLLRCDWNVTVIVWPLVKTFPVAMWMLLCFEDMFKSFALINGMHKTSESWNEHIFIVVFKQKNFFFGFWPPKLLRADCCMFAAKSWSHGAMRMTWISVYWGGLHYFKYRRCCKYGIFEQLFFDLFETDQKITLMSHWSHQDR